ncbi:hypothetical protein IWQ57_001810 [Coemansia nantahalensis]|uniref:Uncharacterized protein n=1 Tax=Coemansia nantahalensis TaxID=2789366 RepID=A0ACC1K2L3_9FUNG|nr:hypothetical protein IWQ57_001810 [Coemansia nantahalensis]
MARAMYEKPALSVAKEQGVTPKYPITKVFLTQLAVVNGFGDPERSLDAIMKATNELFTQDVDGDSGSQITVGSYKVDEIVWLKELLIKAAKMSHPVFSRTVRILSDIVYEGNYKLSKTTKFQGFNWEPVTLECTKFTGSTTIESPSPEE